MAACEQSARYAGRARPICMHNDLGASRPNGAPRPTMRWNALQYFYFSDCILSPIYNSIRSKQNTVLQFGYQRYMSNRECNDYDLRRSQKDNFVWYVKFCQWHFAFTSSALSLALHNAGRRTRWSVYFLEPHNQIVPICLTFPYIKRKITT